MRCALADETGHYTKPTTVEEFEAMLSRAMSTAPPGARFIVHPDDWYTPDRPGYWERELRQSIYHASVRARFAAFHRRIKARLFG